MATSVVLHGSRGKTANATHTHTHALHTHLSMLIAHRLRILAVHIITSSVTKMLQQSRLKSQAPPTTCTGQTGRLTTHASLFPFFTVKCEAPMNPHTSTGDEEAKETERNVHGRDYLVRVRALFYSSALNLSIYAYRDINWTNLCMCLCYSPCPQSALRQSCVNVLG